jgi:hypothetical protein
MHFMPDPRGVCRRLASPFRAAEPVISEKEQKYARHP